MRTSSLCVVAAEPIRQGEVLGQYLGEKWHVRASVRDRPRNRGYCLVMKTRPEFSASSVRVSVNAESMDGMMRFVNHSCNLVAEFREVSNGRRTTIVVATTDFIRQGEETTIDYGDDLWFISRCQDDLCRYREMQDQENP
uniref:SET domain-containing protein n=1 Tax=Phytophthora ramorum TaxID=164328 RepID=H3GRG5_PHYRM